MNNNETNLISVSIIITERYSYNEKCNIPCLEIRKVITDISLIKKVVECASHDQPCIIHPTFKNKLSALNRLVEKGILYKKDNGYFFTF